MFCWLRVCVRYLKLIYGLNIAYFRGHKLTDNEWIVLGCFYDVLWGMKYEKKC